MPDAGVEVQEYKNKYCGKPKAKIYHSYSTGRFQFPRILIQEHENMQGRR
jgi:hypothetical protein